MNGIVPAAAPLQVGIGQLRIGAAGQLQAVLGSCIGIAFLWRKGGCCGLAHCLLPEPPECPLDYEAQGARYVSDAVPALLRQMGARESDYQDIDVVLAGGASMLASSRLRIGHDNAAAARKHLGRLGLRVLYCELGGKRGRQLMVDCAQHSYLIKEIIPVQTETQHEHF